MKSKYENDSQGLYRPEFEHDNCGVGMVANLSGEASHEIVVNGVTILKRLLHRGATGNDPETGDGAGLLLKIPHEFFEKKIGKALGRKERKGRKEESVKESTPFGVAMIFGGEGEEKAIEEVVKSEGCDVLCWRDVPIDPDAIGHDARAVMPRIRQLFIGLAGGSQLVTTSAPARRRRSSTRGFCSPRRSKGSIPISPTRISSRLSRSSTSAIPRTRSRPGNSRIRSAPSPTTARSTRSRAISTPLPRARSRSSRLCSATS